jgi:D-tyrosyl-tRNA(Tyr) deacylase
MSFMIALIQRVSHARVTIDGLIVGEIGRGILAFVGIQQKDETREAERLVSRILDYRIFQDESGRMNQSLRAIGGGLLLVPQFTLAADTRKGTRPSFSTAAPPDQGIQGFDFLVECARRQYPVVQTGRFGADMQVELINDGPVTFWLETKPAT